MSLITRTCSANCGNTYCASASAATAKAGPGSGTNFASAVNLYVGWLRNSGTYVAAPAFFEFDTSGIAGNVLSAFLEIQPSTVSFGGTNPDSLNYQARLCDFGGSVDTGDFRTPAQFAGDTLLGSLAYGSMVASAWNRFSDVALAANINTSGNTRIVICTDQFAADGTPSQDNNTFLMDLSGSPRARLIITTDVHDPVGSRVNRLTYIRR